jgi:prephenate dehydrogenase
MKKVAIIGFGRFGQLLAGLAHDVFEVSVLDSSEQAQKHASEAGYKLITNEDLSSVDVVFLAVPISSFESITGALAPYITKEQLIVDLCSVKIYPISVMTSIFPDSEIIGTHPMFGPDSAAAGLDGLRLALCNVSAATGNVDMIKSFWSDLGVDVIETTPEAHDMDAAFSQAYTYIIAKMVIKSETPDVVFTTRSYDHLKQIAQISANDSDQLFHDMLCYNPYLNTAVVKLENAIHEVRSTVNSIVAEQSERKLGASTE